MRKLFVFVLAVCVFTSLVVSADARVLVKDKSVVKISEDINMGEGLIFKDLVAIKGNINVKGDAGGDVVAVLGKVHLYPTAKVGGDVVAIGGSITKDPGASVKGDIVEISIGKGGMNMMDSMGPMTGAMSIGGYLVLKIVVLLGFIGLAMIVVSFLTKQIGVISSRSEKQWFKMLLWGILSILLTVPLALLLAITIVGIPLILIEIVLISVAMTMGYIAVAQLIGKKFTKAIKKPNQPMIVEIIWGLFILFLVELVPFIGGLIKMLACMIGFGSAVMTKLGTKA